MNRIPLSLTIILLVINICGVHAKVYIVDQSYTTVVGTNEDDLFIIQVVEKLVEQVEIRALDGNDRIILVAQTSGTARDISIFSDEFDSGGNDALEVYLESGSMVVNLLFTAFDGDDKIDYYFEDETTTRNIHFALGVGVDSTSFHFTSPQVTGPSLFGELKIFGKIGGGFESPPGDTIHWPADRMVYDPSAVYVAIEPGPAANQTGTPPPNFFLLDD